MIIPVGLIARGLSGGSDAAAETALLELNSRMQAAAFGEMSSDKQAGRLELADACSGPDACVVVLAGASWGTTELDMVRLRDLADAELLAERPRSPYREADGLSLGAGTQGFFAVPPGRHRVRTTAGGRTVETDFVTLPREGVFRRWDARVEAYVGFEAADEARIVQRLAAKDLPLASYLEHVGLPRMQALLTTTATLALVEAERAVHRLVAAAAANDTASATKAVREAVAALVGIPIPSFTRLTQLVGFHAFELASEGKASEAWTLLQGGLAILPDDPTLLTTLGELQVRAGAREAGKATLTSALAREAGLEAATKERLVQLLSQLE